jgi:hypothetical protein
VRCAALREGPLVLREKRAKSKEKVNHVNKATEHETRNRQTQIFNNYNYNYNYSLSLQATQCNCCNHHCYYHYCNVVAYYDDAQTDPHLGRRNHRSRCCSIQVHSPDRGGAPCEDVSRDACTSGEKQRAQTRGAADVDGHCTEDR